MSKCLSLLHRRKHVVSILIAAACARAVESLIPFPTEEPLVRLLNASHPGIVAALKVAYLFDLYSTPLLLSHWLLSTGYVFFHRVEPNAFQKLPLYIPPESRTRFFLVLGELHHQTSPTRASSPTWLTIEERGGYGNIIAFGAIGTGKTRCLMRPIATQILGFCRENPERRIGGLALEVKGNFCFQLKETLAAHGREEDYIEVSLDSPYLYNPLRNNMSPFALAYGLASLMNNLYGRGKEPFWQQAYTNMVKFIIMLHRVLYDYVTFFDVYHCAINHDLMRERISEAETKLVPATIISIAAETFLEHAKLDQFEFAKDDLSGQLRAIRTPKLKEFLESKRIPFTE